MCSASKWLRWQISCYACFSTINMPSNSWVLHVPAASQARPSPSRRVDRLSPSDREAPAPAPGWTRRRRCPRPGRRGRTHFCTEPASLVLVASFPRTSSTMRSSGAAVRGSSGGTSVMISATCSADGMGQAVSSPGKRTEHNPTKRTHRGGPWPGHRRRLGLRGLHGGREGKASSVQKPHVCLCRQRGQTMLQ